MGKRMSTAGAVLMAWALVLAVALAFAAPAVAQGKSENARSDKAQSQDNGKSDEARSQGNGNGQGDRQGSDHDGDAADQGSRNEAGGRSQARNSSSSSPSSSGHGGSTGSQGEHQSGKFECDPSHHSNTGKGANTSGPYDNTCEPEHEPGNGNDDAPAVGQPCAGCVGNADDKNPPGQLPWPDQPNVGYECDSNQGIGQENPAHTGCDQEGVTGPPPPPPPPGPPGPPGPPPPGPPLTPPGLPLPPEVLPLPPIVRPGPPGPPIGELPPQVLGRRVVAGAGALPVTGAQLWVFVLAGIVLIGGGTGMLKANRS